MRNPKVRLDLEPGLNISLALVPNAPVEKWIEDSILMVLDELDFNPDGVEVKTSRGFIGNVKEIFESNDSLEDVRKRISSRENHEIEMKETFHFDVNENKKNKDRNMDVVKAVSSFLNSDGGHLYIGVHDNGTPMGLDRDYSCMQEKDRNNDSYERQIRTSLKNNLTNYATVLECTKKIEFPVLDGVEICEITVRPSSIPIFLKPQTVVLDLNGKNHQRLIDWYYVRSGNGKEEIKTMSDFLAHYLIRFENDR